MSSDIIQALPNLGVGAAAIYALYLVCKMFLDKLDKRETEMRALEKEVRGSIVAQLSEAAAQMKSNSHVMNRVIDFLDRQEMHAASSPKRSPKA